MSMEYKSVRITVTPEDGNEPIEFWWHEDNEVLGRNAGLPMLVKDYTVDNGESRRKVDDEALRVRGMLERKGGYKKLVFVQVQTVQPTPEMRQQFWANTVDQFDGKDLPPEHPLAKHSMKTLYLLDKIIFASVKTKGRPGAPVSVQERAVRLAEHPAVEQLTGQNRRLIKAFAAGEYEGVPDDDIAVQTVRRQMNYMMRQLLCVLAVRAPNHTWPFTSSSEGDLRWAMNQVRKGYNLKEVVYDKHDRNW